MKLLPDKSVIAVIELVEMTIHTICVGFDKLNHRIFYLSGSFFLRTEDILQDFSLLPAPVPDKLNLAYILVA